MNAAAIVNFDGSVVNQTGFALITRTGPGAYALTLAAPPTTPLPIVSLIKNNAAGRSTTVVVLNGFDVFTTDASGNPTDRSFSIVVYAAA